MGRKNKIHIVEIVKNILTKKALSRNADEILLKEAEYEDKIWYTRHIALKQRGDQSQEFVDPKIWQDNLYSAQLLRERYGEENLLPKSYFELGIWYGWLAELRWLLGDSENNFNT